MGHKDYLDPGELVSELLLTAGPSSDMGVNGSVTPVEFEFTADGAVFLSSVAFSLLDATSLPTAFGGVAALTNGLTVELIDTDGTTVLHDFLAGLTVKKTADFAYLGVVTVALSVDGSGDDHQQVVWDVERTFGAPLLLKSGQALRVTVQDDLTGLTEFQGMALGRKFPSAVPIS